MPAIREHTIAYQKAGGRGDFSAYYETDERHAVIRQPLRRKAIVSQHNVAGEAPMNE